MVKVIIEVEDEDDVLVKTTAEESETTTDDDVVYVGWWAFEDAYRRHWDILSKVDHSSVIHPSGVGQFIIFHTKSGAEYARSQSLVVEEGEPSDKNQPASAHSMWQLRKIFIPVSRIGNMVKVTIEADADTIVQLANAAERRALQNKDANRMDRYENLMAVVEDLDDAVTNRDDGE